MKDKKGFTLTEILATLAILAIVIAIAVPSLNALIKSFERKYYESLESTVLSSAKNYYKDHPEERPTGILYSSAITINGLIKNKYIDSAKVYKKKDDCTGYVVVVNEGEGNYNYKTCMVCNNDLKVKNEDDKKYCAYNDKGEMKDKNSSEVKLVTTKDKQTVLNDVNDSISNNASVVQNITAEDITLPVSSEFTMNQYWKKYIDYKLSKSFDLKIKDINKETLFSFNVSDYKPKNISNISLRAGNEYSVTYVANGSTETMPLRTVKVVQIEKPTYKDDKTVQEPDTSKFNFEKKVTELQKLDSNGWVKDNCSGIKNCMDSTKYRYKYIDKIDNIDYNFYSLETDVTKKYKLTFNFNYDGAPVEKSYDLPEGQEKELEKVEDRTGYTFLGWFDAKEDGKGTKYNDKYVMGSKDVKLYAHWKTNSLKLKYDLNCQNCASLSKPESKDVKYGTNYDGLLPNEEKVGTRVGYKLEGWYVHKNGKEIKKTIKDIITYDDADNVDSADNNVITLYAHWTINSYTLSFNTDGGTPRVSDRNVKYNDLLSDLPTNITKTGYTFLGWYKLDETKVTNDTRMPAENLKLTAKWKKNKYTLNYYSGICTIDETSVEREYDEEYGELPESNSEGCTITKWTSSMNSSARIVKSTDKMPNKDVTIYAVGEYKKYNLTFDANGGLITSNGSSTLKREMHYNDSINNFPTVSRNGYTFLGWYTTTSGGNKVTEDEKMPAKDLTLYAQWKSSDSSNPTCNIIVTSGKKGNNNYYTSDVSIKLNMDDDIGVTNYGLTTNLTETYNNSYIVNNLSTTTTYYGYVKDAAGNKGNCKSTILIDKTPPAIPTLTYTKETSKGSYTLGNWTNETINRYISSTDNGESGISHFRFKDATNSNGTWICNANSNGYENTETLAENIEQIKDDEKYQLNFSPYSTNRACFQAVDKAGNASDWTDIQEILIDKTAPDIPTLEYTKDNGNSYTAGTWTNLTIHRKIKSNDNGGSGISHFRFKEATNSNGTWICNANSNGYEDTETLANGVSPILDNTEYKINYSPGSTNRACFQAVDKAGNASDWTDLQEILIDKTPPFAPGVTAITYDILGLCGNKNESYNSVYFKTRKEYNIQGWYKVLSTNSYEGAISYINNYPRNTQTSSAQANVTAAPACFGFMVQDNEEGSGIAQIGIKKCYSTGGCDQEFTFYDATSMSEVKDKMPFDKYRTNETNFWITAKDKAGNQGPALSYTRAYGKYVFNN